MAAQVRCRITGGRENVCIEHSLDVPQDGSFSLSDKLAVLKDCVNESLTVLVEKEKAAMRTNGERQCELLEEPGDSGINVW